MTNQRRGKSLAKSQAPHHATKSPSEATIAHSFTYGGETVKVSFWPRGATLTDKEISTEQDAIKQLAFVLTEWNLTDGDGKPCEITEEAIAALPEHFIETIYDEIRQVLRRKNAEFRR